MLNIFNTGKEFYREKIKNGGLITMIAAALFIDFLLFFGSNLSWGTLLLSVRDRSDCSYLVATI